MSDFWRNVFKKLSIEILTSIVYHLQTDEQSERINQTIEIILKYWTTINSSADFIEKLSYIQININNIISAIIGHTSNELCYGFRIRNNLDLLIDLSEKDYIKLRLQYRELIEESIAWTNIIAKTIYDNKHTRIDLKKSSYVYLRFYHDYIISNIINKKLFNQRVESFKILEKIENLTYHLKLSSVMKIHLVMSVIQLKSVSLNENFYQRSRSDQEKSSSMTDEDSDDLNRSYIIEQLLNKRINKNRTQYLIKWLNYGSIHNVWYNNDDLSDAENLMKEFEQRLSNRSELFKRVRKTRQFISSASISFIVQNRTVT